MFKLAPLVCMRFLASSCVKRPAVKSVKPEGISLALQSVRNSSFFNRLTQKELWKGTTSVSNAGRRKGRGKLGDRKGKRDLNKGQRVGEGNVRIQLPGLNIGVLSDKGVNEIKALPDFKKPESATPGVIRRRKRNKNPLERGWTGSSVKGRSIGPPDPIQDEVFENFKSVVLEYKVTVLPTALLGKKRRLYSLVCIGNGDGVFGFGSAKTNEGKISLKLARNRAVKKLLTVDLIEKHTVNHDFFSQYGKTKVYVFKKPEGYGLVCHRIIKSICQLIGIKNLSAKVEGPCNAIHITRAFVVGLLRQVGKLVIVEKCEAEGEREDAWKDIYKMGIQKTYQEIADEKRLHLVEFRKESLNFPLLLASPENCLKQSELGSNPVLFEEYIMGDRLVKKKGKPVPFFMKLPSWKTYLKRTSYHRNHEEVKINLMVKYGSLRSHLTDAYPECVAPGLAKKQEKS